MSTTTLVAWLGGSAAVLLTGLYLVIRRRPQKGQDPPTPRPGTFPNPDGSQGGGGSSGGSSGG